MKAQKLGIIAGLGLALLGCGATFDPPTEIKTLRIIGVQKDKPYAQPGDSVTLTMLWHDGTKSGEAMPPRKVQITWLGGCLNPPGDSYQGCFAQYAAAYAALLGAGAPSSMPPSGMPPSGSAPSGSAPSSMGPPSKMPPEQITVGLGSSFMVRIPTDAEYGAPVMHPNQDPRLPAYGLSYVFFAVCAGNVVKGDEHFPLHCQDDQGHDLGPDDFVIGYSSIYFFAPRSNGEPYLNANPETDGFYFGPQEVTGASCSSGFESGNFAGSCLGTCDESGECTNQPPAAIDCNDTDYSSLCIPACKDDGDPQKCPANNLRLDFKHVTFEKDDISNDAYGTNYGEQMWIDYYSTRGRFHSSTKLLNDATSGYNNNNGTQFYAPSTPGPVQLWAVMHDNRGGVSWVGTTLMVQ